MTSADLPKSIPVHGMDATKIPHAPTPHEERERFRLLVEHSCDLIIEVTRDGRLLYVSPNVHHVLGYTNDELGDTWIFDYVHPDDQGLAQATFAQPVGSTVCRCRHKDGSWRWLETTCREYATDSGAMRSVLIARDVTARRLAEADRAQLNQELYRQERLSALGIMAGGAAHDFNNVLTAIACQGELALMDGPQPSVRAAIAEILKATDHARNLVQQILGFSRQRRTDPQPVQLSGLVREALNLLRPTLPPQIEVVMDLSDDPCQVLADSTQIYQVLVNLGMNARHAIGYGAGRLEVRLDYQRLEQESVQFNQFVLPPGLYARLSVTDNGHGMDEATQRKIFEPFFTTKNPADGTGLGLAIVQRIVRDHRGAITVASQVGRGTTFSVFLPVFSAAGQEHRRPSDSTLPQ